MSTLQNVELTPAFLDACIARARRERAAALADLWRALVRRATGRHGDGHAAALPNHNTPATC